MNLDWMATLYFPVGVGIGLIAAAPIGPVNILVIQRCVQQGMRPALLLGLGAALGDAVFAAAAACGMAALHGAVDHATSWVRAIGGVVLLIFGLGLWRAAPHLGQPGRPVPRARHMALATFFMTVTNPATFLWFAAIFGSVGFVSIGMSSPTSLFNAARLVAGVGLGSMLWWLAVSGLTHQLRGRLTDRFLVIVNHITAVVLAGFGLMALADGLLG